MSNQLQTGLIYLENASNLVYRIHECTITTSDTWTVGDNVTWPGGGSGYVVYWNAVDKILGLRMDGDMSGNFPALSDVLTGPTAESGTITAIAPLPDFSAFLTPILSERVEVAVVGHQTAQFGNTATDLTADRFRLSANWSDATVLSTEYGLHVDFAPLGDPLILTGDRNMPELINRGIVNRNSREQFYGGHIQQTSNEGLTTAWNELAFGTVITDSASLWVEVGNAGINIPAGIARVDVFVQLATDIGEDTNTIHLRLTQGSSTEWSPKIQNGQWGSEYLQLVSLGLSVSESDIIRVEAKTGAGTANALATHTHLLVRASEYSAV